MRMLFIIASPRSGSTMLERLLESHPRILGGPEPHLITPLAHLGVWANVDKAPYDVIISSIAQKHFVSRLPSGLNDYQKACRAYCDTLYGRLLETARHKDIVLDKTPAYALVLPFLSSIYPDAHYVVLTRHPAAITLSHADSFFDGDLAAAHAHNPILERYVPAIATFLRDSEPPLRFHVRYEDLVTDPETWMNRLCHFLDIPFDGRMLEYNNHTLGTASPPGLADPTGASHRTRPDSAALLRWADTLASDPDRLAFIQNIIHKLDPDDLETLGYPISELWKPLESRLGNTFKPRHRTLTAYAIQRKLIMRLRAMARRHPWFRGMLSKVRLACDVILRE